MMFLSSYLAGTLYIQIFGLQFFTTTNNIIVEYIELMTKGSRASNL